MYKYVSSDSANGAFLPKSFYNRNKGVLMSKKKEHEKVDKFRQRYCNNINSNLMPEDEGGFIDGWTLQGEKIFLWLFWMFEGNLRRILFVCVFMSCINGF